MTILNRDVLKGEDRSSFEAARTEPVVALQIGEGNFLRGFFDWMMQRCRQQGLIKGSVAVTQPRPSGRAKIEKLANQDGLYTLVTRGLENGKAVERKEIVTVFREAFDPYSEWEKFLGYAASPELRFVVSNTTEAGLVYRPEELQPGEPVQSFPGKVALLLYRRYEAFGGSPDSGLIFLPCELLERNGDELKRCVLRYCEDWGLPAAFKSWVEEHNRFLNSLVDRIVTGYPADTAESWFTEWGYEDAMLNTAEPYHLWAIEAGEEMERELPLRLAGLNVFWVDDLRPFQQRKVRILNGAHTLMTPLALLHGVETVREAMEHPELGRYVRETVEREIIPSVPMAADELKAYAETVYERFLNPFIRHRLADIAMNSLSKFRTRLMPSLLHYAERGETIPDRLVRSLAALLRYYRIEKTGETEYQGRTLQGAAYPVRDDAALLERIAGIWAEAMSPAEASPRLLAMTELWGADLSVVDGLSDRIAGIISEMEDNGHE